MTTQRDREALEADYAKALNRAQQQGLSVRAEGDGADDGVRYWFVNSATDPGGDWHRVWIDHRQLLCSCPAGRHGTPCTHKAVVRAQLKTEQEAVRHEEVRQYEARQQRHAGRRVEYEPRRGRVTRCSVCAADFIVGEEILLRNGAALHPFCDTAE